MNIIFDLITAIDPFGGGSNGWIDSSISKHTHTLTQRCSANEFGLLGFKINQNHN